MSAEASNILADRTMLRLDPEAAERFALALAAPAKLNDRLHRAWAREQQFGWVD